MTTTLKREVTKSILSVVFPYKTIFRPCLQLYQSIVSRVASPQTSFGDSFVTHSFLPPWGRNECVTNEPQRTSAGRLPKKEKKTTLYNRRLQNEALLDYKSLKKSWNRLFAQWHHFTITTRILQGFAFLCKLGLLLFKPHWDNLI